MRGAFSIKLALLLVCGCGGGPSPRATRIEPGEAATTSRPSSAAGRVRLLGGVVSSPLGPGARADGAQHQSPLTSAATLAVQSAEPPVGIGVVATRVLHRASPETSSRDLEKLIGASTSAYRVSPVSVGGRPAVRLDCHDEPNAPRCDVDAPLAILCVELDDSSWAVLRYEGWPRRTAVTVSDSWKERIDLLIAGLTVSSEEALQLPDRTRQTLAPGVPSPWESCFDGADYRVVEFREISSIEVPEAAVTLYFGNYPDVPGAPGVPDSEATGAWLYTNDEHTASALFLLSELCGPSVDEEWHQRFAHVVVQAPTAAALHTHVASLHIADSTEQLCALAAPTFPCR